MYGLISDTLLLAQLLCHINSSVTVPKLWMPKVLLLIGIGNIPQ